MATVDGEFPGNVSFLLTECGDGDGGGWRARASPSLNCKPCWISSELNRARHVSIELSKELTVRAPVIANCTSERW